MLKKYGLACGDFGSEELLRFRDGLANLGDERHPSYVRHVVGDIIVIAFLAVLADADDWQKIWIFADKKKEWLTGLLGLRNGIPSHDTIQDVISMIDQQALFAACLSFLMGKIDAYSEMARHDDPFKKPDIPITSIDGKTSRGSAGADTGNGAIRPLHTLNAVSSDYGFCIGQVFVPEKTNEITAVDDLLGLLDVSGTVVTWDALNTQKGNVGAVIGRGGDYVVALKANHPNLSEEVKDYFADEGLLKDNPLVSRHKTAEKEHSAVITREYILSREVDWIYDRKSWEGLGAIGCVRKTIRPLSGTATTETRYYLSSVTEIGLFSRAVRQHWSVESFHWHMDVTFRDDANMTRDKKGAQAIQIMKKAALALLKLVQPMYVRRSLKNIRYTLSLGFECEIEKIFSYLDVGKAKAELLGKGLIK
jgi:predicted transposase YbfD/YdcC